MNRQLDLISHWVKKKIYFVQCTPMFSGFTHAKEFLRIGRKGFFGVVIPQISNALFDICGVVKHTSEFRGS